MERRLTIRRPDDFHVHFRDGAMLEAVAPWTARQFGRATIMPNLDPPLTDCRGLRAYRARIEAACRGIAGFTPLMTLYLNHTVEVAALREGVESGLVTAVKYYPRGATTHSAAGVGAPDEVAFLLEVMEELDVLLLVHGEAPGDGVDPFDREAPFLDHTLEPLRRRYPGLRIVLEHVTTREGVAFVRTFPRMGATITPHHLALDRGALFRGGLRPHYYCLPLLKRSCHREALLEAACSGDPRFFLGTDSAPHPVSAREAACGCAGIFNAPAALAVLAQLFEEQDRLEQLEAFTSQNGAAFYGLSPGSGSLTLIRTAEPCAPAAPIDAGDAQVMVFDPGFPLYWRVADPAVA